MQTTDTTAIAPVTRGRRPGWMGWLMLAPMVAWLMAFVVAPTAILVVASFTHAHDETGFPVYRQPAEVEDSDAEEQRNTYTTENYKRIFLDDEGNFVRTDEEDVVATTPEGDEEVVGSRKVTRMASPYMRVFAFSVLYAAITTALCVLVGYPVAWFVGRCREGTRNWLLMLIMIPFWTSFLIRTYAWITILANEGLLNGLLVYARAISEPFDFLYTPGAVVLGLFYSYLPFMILPIYGSVEKLDGALIEASLDLGAGPFRTFRKVILPLTRPGVFVGVMLVFVPAVGMFAISGLLGGGRTQMIGDVIQNQFFAGRDWPFGSALGMTLVGMFVFAFLLTSRLRASRS